MKHRDEAALNYSGAFLKELPVPACWGGLGLEVPEGVNSKKALTLRVVKTGPHSK